MSAACHGGRPGDRAVRAAAKGACWLALASCAPAAPGPVPPAAMASASALDSVASPSPPALSSMPPIASTSASGALLPPDAPPGGSDRLTIEPPYRPGSYPWPAGADAKRGRVADLDLWNRGGRSDKAWHPYPRVVVSEPVIARGKLDSTAAMRALRASRYGAIRHCYDEALRATPDLEGRTIVRLSVAPSGVVNAAAEGGGRVPDPRKHGHAMPNGAVRSCIARAFHGAKVPPPRTRSATLLVAVDLWPGDVTMPEPAGGAAAGKCDLAEAAARLEIARPRLVACFVDATSSAPSLWGRSLSQVDIGEDGTASNVREVESSFPQPDASRCVQAVLAAIDWPKPIGGAARLLVPMRWRPSEGGATTNAATGGGG